MIIVINYFFSLCLCLDSAEMAPTELRGPVPIPVTIGGVPKSHHSSPTHGAGPGDPPRDPPDLSLTCWPNINLQLQAGSVHRVRGGRGCGRKRGQRIVGTAAKRGSRHRTKIIINIGRKGGIAVIFGVILPLRMRK